jgi:hypothetical protein
VEVSMSSLNKFHVSFESVHEFLGEFNYNIFGIYEQVREFNLKKPILRRCNIVYISKEIAGLEI